MLNWEESDFIECFEVDSFFEEQDEAYEFNLVGDDVDAQVRVFPSKELISIRVISKKTGEFITEMFYLVLGSIIFDSDTQTISLMDSVPVDGEFFHTHFNVGDLPINYRFRVEISNRPEFHVSSFLQ